MVVFPEGTVTRDSDLNPMTAKSGAARLALKTGAPLIPCALVGDGERLAQGIQAALAPRATHSCAGRAPCFGDDRR